VTSANATVYCRISDDRAGAGLGVARQEADCRALCEARGWTIAEVLVDNDRSAYSGQPRHGYDRLMELIKGKQIDAVVAWHPDRLHRSPRELESFIDAVEAAHVQVVTVQGGEYDLSTAAGRMTARVVGAVARHESEHKSERITRKHAELAAAGKVGGGGTRPFGFEPDRVTVREPEAEVIREAARRIAAGEAIRGVVRDLTARGVTSPTGKPWPITTFRRMITSPRIAGLRQHGRDVDGRALVVGEASWPAIVDRGTWEACRRVVHDPSRKAARPARRYLLTGGIARCGLCDAKLVARPKGDGRRSYVCARGPGFDGCGKLRALAEPFEDLIVLAVLARLDGPGLAAAVDRRADPSSDDGATELAQVEARLDELARMFANGEIGRREWLAARTTLDARRETLTGRLAAQARTSAIATLAEGDGLLSDRWAELSFDKQRAVLAAVLDRVIVNPAVRGRNTFDPARFSLDWQM